MAKGPFGFDVETFFDRKAVMNAVSKATWRFLRRAGGTIRLVARRSIRKRKSISEPGNPPHSHTGKLKRKIFFGFERARGTVVVGPTPRPSEGGGDGPGSQVVEHGGTVLRKDRRGKVRRLEYRPRPFMGPALAKVQPRLPDFWKDSVRK